MKKIIFLLVSHFDCGGQERFISRLTYILEKDYDIKLLVYDNRIIGYPYNCEMINLNCYSKNKNVFSRIYWIIKKIIKLRQCKKKYNPYACISFGMSVNLYNILSMVKGCKNILSIRGYGTVAEMKSKKGLIFSKLYKKANNIICVSKNIAMEVERIIGDKSKISLLYNAYDVNEIEYNSEEALSEEEKAMFSPNTVVSVGTYRYEKGYWHLLKAFAQVKDNIRDARLIIIGPKYSNYFEKTLELVKKLHLEDGVILMDFNGNPYKYIKNSKVYVLSSISEGFPNALVEAMACGVPVIAADCKTGPREILFKDDYNDNLLNLIRADYGILVPAMSSKENYNEHIIEECEKKLAEAIEIFLTDRELCEEYGEKAKNRAKEFSYDRCREEIIRIIESE